jgi:hypothetical protein
MLVVLVSVKQLVVVLVSAHQAMNHHHFHQVVVQDLVLAVQALVLAVLVLMLLLQLSIVPIATKTVVSMLVNLTNSSKVVYKKLIFSFSHISLLYQS